MCPSPDLDRGPGLRRSWSRAALVVAVFGIGCSARVLTSGYDGAFPACSDGLLSEGEFCDVYYSEACD
ncbi:MAG: hypothetical protein ACPHRO_00930, partial [Nannocystaceae bacterium]